jgi:hypothetical protein
MRKPGMVVPSRVETMGTSPEGTALFHPVTAPEKC